MNEFAFDTYQLPMTTAQFDRMARLLVGHTFMGVSRGPTSVRVHHEGGFLSSEQTAAMLNVMQGGAYGLTMVVDKASILADDTDMATITVTGAVLAGDADVSYWVYFTGVIGSDRYNESEWGDGTAAVSVGSATLTLKTATPGEYSIIVRRTNALHISRIDVTAT